MLDFDSEFCSLFEIQSKKKKVIYCDLRQCNWFFCNVWNLRLKKKNDHWPKKYGETRAAERTKLHFKNTQLASSIKNTVVKSPTARNSFYGKIFGATKYYVSMSVFVFSRAFQLIFFDIFKQESHHCLIVIIFGQVFVFCLTIYTIQYKILHFVYYNWRHA